jgi:aspartate kinase
VGAAVVPGFFGATPEGKVKTFSRGGSDVTGAIVARAVHADVYENWTDTDGVLMADPRIVDNPLPIETITYRELRELAYMGATVLHDEAIFPVRKAGIPVNIRNTNNPTHAGTMIVSEAGPVTHQGTITGIAGRKDFTVIAVEKALMNQEIGFGRRLLSAFEINGVSYEHTPSGIDTMSIVVADSQLNGKLDLVLDEIRRQCDPDSLEVYPKMALIATVGRGMAHTPGIAARLFSALAQHQVNIRMIDQGSSELNIIVGVQANDFEKAVRAIYAAFVQA